MSDTKKLSPEFQDKLKEIQRSFEETREQKTSSEHLSSTDHATTSIQEWNSENIQTVLDVDQAFEKWKESHSKLNFSEGYLIEGRYLVLKKIGQGGMGGVYQVEDKQEGRVVALKVTLEKSNFLNETYIKRFQREIRAMKELKHPGIVRIYDVGEEQGRLFYTMDYVEGKPLGSIQFAERSQEEWLQIMLQILEAVSYAHEKGFVHRDLKPDNILVSGTKPGLMDFGIVKILEASTQITQEGFILGTPLYMSPEQAMGEEVDQRSDIFALGIILYKLLTNVRPFTGDSKRDILRAIVMEYPKRPSEILPSVSSTLEDICFKAIEKDKEERYATAGEFADDIRKYLDGSKVSVRKSHMGSQLRKHGSTLIIHFLVIVILILVVLLIKG